MKPEIFSDGFSNVTFRNGMVRIELGSLPKVGEDDMQSSLESHHKLVVTPQGFLSRLAMMLDLASLLADAGVIRRSEVDGPDKCHARIRRKRQALKACSPTCNIRHSL